MTIGEHGYNADDKNDFSPEELAFIDNLPDPEEDLSPEDINRRAFENFVMSRTPIPGRFLPSHGALHIIEGTGREHRADLENVSQLISSFQGLVSSLGGAIRGKKNVRGKLASDIVRDTRLKLDASPLPGSVILSISPEAEPKDELKGEDEALIDPKTDQLLDEVFPQLDSLFEQMVQLPEDPSQELDAENSALANTLQDLGPRVASSLRHLTDISSASDFSIDISWEQPLKSTIRTSRLLPDIAQRVTTLIANSATDEEIIEISGKMRTVSDIEALAITPFSDDGKEGKALHISGTDLSDGALTGISVGSRVVIQTAVTRTSGTIDGRSHEKYKAINIRLAE
ncbi:hypothetical protein [Bifidobacterium crudilactis]|jgi:hypothetical protein|uniref:hypothetical protein n=1 Tax=Bifidobacterium crudilactis TaxID=327277 RepID=UPI002F354386